MRIGVLSEAVKREERVRKNPPGSGCTGLACCRTRRVLFMNVTISCVCTMSD